MQPHFTDGIIRIGENLGEGEGSALLHIVFETSFAGRLRFALNSQVEMLPETSPQFSELFHEARSVFSLEGGFHVGKLGDSPFGEERRSAVLNLTLCEQWPGAEEAVPQWAEEVWQNYVADFQQVLQRIWGGERAVIWCDASVYSLCGLYALLWELGNGSHDLWMAEVDARPRELSSAELWALRNSARPITAAERKELCGRWKMLRQEDAPFRTLLNGEVVSADEEVFDEWIRQYLPLGRPVKVSELVLRMNEDKLARRGLDYGVTVMRLKEMIKNGELMMLQRGEQPVDSVLQRN